MEDLSDKKIAAAAVPNIILFCARSVRRRVRKKVFDTLRYRRAALQTHLADFIRDTRQAAKPTRSCASACTAAFALQPARLISCRRRLDEPRAVIYLMKQVLEGATATAKTTPSRPLPDLPRVRNHLPVRC
jgi:hypothetical protein